MILQVLVVQCDNCHTKMQTRETSTISASLKAESRGWLCESDFYGNEIHLCAGCKNNHCEGIAEALEVARRSKQ